MTNKHIIEVFGFALKPGRELKYDHPEFVFLSERGKGFHKSFAQRFQHLGRFYIDISTVPVGSRKERRDIFRDRLRIDASALDQRTKYLARHVCRMPSGEPAAPPSAGGAHCFDDVSLGHSNSFRSSRQLTRKGARLD